MQLGTDLVTFYNPDFWGVSSEVEIAQLAQQDGRAFWMRLLDAQASTGVAGIELTFPPFDWRGAVAAFGSIDALLNELGQRGLAIWSSFFPDLDRIPISEHSASEQRILQSALDAAQFLSAVGGRVLVVGLPCRSTWCADPVQFVDMALAQPMADLLNRMGALTAREGIMLAVHTEAHSVCCAPRDVDLFMLLTDPRYVSLCFDPAHIILEGGNPTRVLDRHLERVVAMHWKDASGIMPLSIVIDETIYAKHRPYFRPLGEGDVDFSTLRSLLENAPLKCGPILEMDSCPAPEQALQKAAAFVRNTYGLTSGTDA
ncbi:sugar phosphate isomerase/epimerase family protein [Gluconobacter thailandicus]|uniref:Sugar phosphate isomerase/epimerase n=1 Tax=Gluconobacter thailandicus TaxID=257438 RepID=A0AAP9ESI2_GLUTH|nr:sugar phosphate isomerase/epimerase [Gluconobacter thailandicus]QEH96939.1 sugar phosphate isomerase/epimerase [Gluconobacter thailandicus]